MIEPFYIVFRKEVHYMNGELAICKGEKVMFGNPEQSIYWCAKGFAEPDINDMTVENAIKQKRKELESKGEI